MTRSATRVHPDPRNREGKSKLVFAGWLLLLLTFGGVLAAAQGVSGRIVGAVTDSSGAVVPNAAVTITNQDVGTITKTVSNASGDYRAITFGPVITWSRSRRPD